MSTMPILRMTPGLLVAALLVGCGAQSGSASPSGSHAGSGSARSTAEPGSSGTSSSVPSPLIVRKPLTAAQRQAFLTWMTSWRGCMAGRGVDLPAPEVHPRDISIDVSAVAGYLKPNQPVPTLPSRFEQKTMGCISELGGPPATFLRTAGIVDLFRGTCAVAAKTNNDAGKP